jgi:hypothetical protein
MPLEQPKTPILHLYVDESGSRHPDKAGTIAKHGYDWFSMGGILVNQEDVETAKTKVREFAKTWTQIRSPLHFTDMRANKKGFAWLGNLDQQALNRFWSSYRTFLASMPVVGTGCIIDRPGYLARGYGKREGDAKWLLCRSAFDILLERSAKFAKLKGRRLKVYYERADPTTNERVESYYSNLKNNGLEFDAARSSKYSPMTSEDFKFTLLDIEGKDKANTLMQVADSYIYAVSRGAYENSFDVYSRLAQAGKLVTSHVPGPQAGTLGIKSYCFELVQKAKTTKAGV